MNSYIYNRNTDIVRIEILDETGRRIDRFVFNLGNAKLKNTIARVMKDKYGFFPAPEIDEENDVSAFNAKQENQKKTNWLGLAEDF